jgi:hypothetical protein
MRFGAPVPVLFGWATVAIVTPRAHKVVPRTKMLSWGFAEDEGD